MRVVDHPVLGKDKTHRRVTFRFDGRMLTAFEGEPIAAALMAAGIRVHRYTEKYHEPRGISCALGRCTDCVMIVDGIPNTRTCVMPVKEGMDVRTQHGLGEEIGQP